MSVSVLAQISPGPLSKAHSSLDGAADCIKCHKISAGKPTFGCLDCHTEIASRVAAGKGLHAFYAIKPGDSQGCRRCHSDHNGKDFSLIKWDILKFDHKQAGYVLEGKHAGLACNKCHTSARVARDQVTSIKIKDLNRTFLGVSPSCTTCHQDPHKGRLGANCLQCHNFLDWKTIRVGKFDHSRTRYPLTGLHAQVACEKCHTPGPDKRPRYTGIPFAQCTDCHEDPHHGSFSQSCSTCHSTAGWKKISTAGLDQNFDHSKTRYPLLGKHVDVGCLKCHAGGNFKKKLAFQKCMDCHADYHRGQFIARSKGACETCHTVAGFKPSKFGLKEHATTAYPLQGGHAKLQCAQCHVPKGAATVYKLRFQHCTDCHGDRHAGQFAAAPFQNNCEMCHSLKGYVPSTFTRARHQQTHFELKDSHAAVPCGDCHKESAEFKPKPAAKFHWSETACTNCHADPHSGQFNTRSSTGFGPLRCESCHSAKSWRDGSRFDHSRTSFPLLGTHKTTACSACHKPSAPNGGIKAVDFKTAPTKCEQCHTNVHGGQFAKKGTTYCAECHESTKWKPSLFDHDTKSAFPLQGAHRKARCNECHKLTRVINGTPVLFYSPTPKECAACHHKEMPKP